MRRAGLDGSRVGVRDVNFFVCLFFGGGGLCVCMCVYVILSTIFLSCWCERTRQSNGTTKECSLQLPVGWMNECMDGWS